MEEIIIPSGIKIGSYNDDYTGVTVVMCEKGAVAGVDVRGGAPGTRETDLLRPEKAMEKNYEYDENGDILRDENGEPVEASKGSFSYGDGPMIEVYAMTQEQYDTVNGLIENTNRIMRYDQSLMEIINDEAGAFFAGEKTAEETAQLIQNCVQLYMAEQG